MNLPTTISKSNLRLQARILVAGSIIMVAKFAAYFITHSNAILTDALESIVNIVAGAFGVYSLYLAAKPKDTDHPYGHGKIEFIAASIEGSLIGATGIMMVLKSSIGFFSPIKIHSLDWGLIIISIAGLLNFFLGLRLHSQGKKNNSIVLIAGGKHLLTDAYTTVGIIVGLVVISITKLYFIDNVIAILLGVYIVYGGVTIVRSSVAGIMDEADTLLIENVINVLNKNRQQAWVDVHNMRIIKYGSSLHIDCHVTLPWYFNIQEAHQQTNAIEELIKQQFPQGVELFIHTDACIESSCKVCALPNCSMRKHPFVSKVDWNLTNVMQNQKHGL